MEGENSMKDFTAKELENLFSKKQLSVYNQKLTFLNIFTFIVN